MPKPRKMNSVAEAVESRGGLSPVAREFGISPAAVARWVDDGEVPLERLARFCELVGSRHPGDYNSEVRKLLRDFAGA